MNARILRGLAALLCFALPLAAEAASINFTGSGTTANASGVVDFAIRNNESSGEKTLALTGGALTYYFDWDTDVLWLGFDLPWGGYTETYTGHRTTPYRTSPSSTVGTGTRDLTSGIFVAAVTYRNDDYLITGTIPWRIGAGAPVAAPVPDGAVPVAMVAALLGLMAAVHRRFSGAGGDRRCSA